MGISLDLSGLTFNDCAYLLMHLAIVVSFLIGLYEQYAKVRLKQFVHSKKLRLYSKGRKIKVNVTRNFRNTASKIKRLFLKDKTHHTIKPDSIKLTLSSTYAVVKIVRGKESWAYFGLAWTVLSVLVIEVNGLYARAEKWDFSILILLADIGIVTWLCFYSAWFRNIIIRVVNHRNNTPG